MTRTATLPATIPMSERVAVPAIGPVDVLGAFLAGRNAKTLDAYQKDIADFGRHLGTTPADAAEWLLSRTHGEANRVVLGYKTAMVEKGLQPATVNRRLAALRSLVKLARTLGRIAWAIDVENAKAEAYRDTRGPGLVGFSRMLAELPPGNDPKPVRDRAMLRLLWGLGLRRGELVGLDLAHWDADGGRLAVLGKGRTGREWLTVPRGAREALNAWLAVRGPAPGALFHNLHLGRPGDRLTDNAVYRIVRDLGAKAGLSRIVSPHRVRHASITEVVKRNGGSVRAGQKFARHRNSATTERYLDDLDDAAGRMADLVDGALEG